MFIFSKIFLSKLFFVFFFGIVLLFCVSSIWEFLFFPTCIAMLVLILCTLIDLILIFSSKHPLKYKRIVAERLNLGDSNKIELQILNTSNQLISFRMYEGFPDEMQERSNFFDVYGLKSGEKKTFHYEWTPKQRGEYQFKSVFFMIYSLFHLVMRRYEINAQQKVKVYPSILQLKKYELMVFHQQKINIGLKRMRRLGNNSEFEQIKNYVQGDEIKTINWKATSRTNHLMVNKFQEEKSQTIYCILDKSRSMQMEFDQLSLLDYAINSILVLSNIMLRNGDKTGLVTFSNKIGSHLSADKKKNQLRLILETLYNQKTAFKDADYELLYQTFSGKIKNRSLIILFTNFETEAALERALPMLNNINKKHVLLTILFQNSDLEALAMKNPETMRDVYQSIVVEKMNDLKNRIELKLKQNGIQTILTSPENLSIQVINKYLEIKARGLL